MTQHKILLVEDDQRLAELVETYLQNNGFEVYCVANGDLVASQLQLIQPDLLILDINLPGKDGLTICKNERKTYTNPILMLTAREDDIDQILGFEYGADDYVIKPVEPRVLLARIQALLRRTRHHKADHILRWDHLEIDVQRRTLVLKDQLLEVPTNDFDLLWFLALNAGQIMSREALFQAVYHREYDGLDRSIDVRVSSLRKHLKDDAEKPKVIKTIWGKGYLFLPEILS